MKTNISITLQFSALIVSVLLVSACSGGRRTATSLQYITEADVLSVKLPEVPQAGSALFESDFKTLHEWQGTRTDDECNLAQKDINYDFRNIFPKLKSFYDNLPEVNRQFLDSVGAETWLSIKIAQEKYNRRRPYMTDPTLLPCIDKPSKKSMSYPSGHATLARVYALLLTELMPGRRSEFLTRADNYGRNRIVGGIHHPTDIEAGRRFANALFARYMQNKLFRANLNNLRQYLPKNRI